ncbi:hypothetical protein [Chitinophaga sp.]|uniref:hypothetical protein n=1 Tax=Chitinophaga sp. TaxID=1869181 RepID=UPI002D7F20D6|nr:hypothetical protein [Chitinophaga sp.]
MTNQSINASCGPNMREINLLFVLYNRAVDLPNLIKTKICDDLGWSEAKFYRRMRYEMDDNKQLRSLSKAERRAVIEIFRSEYESNMEHLSAAIQAQQK